MSPKCKERTHDALLDGIETKLLVSSSKHRIHEGFLESTRDSLNPQGDNFLELTIERNRQSLNYINLKTKLPLGATVHLNSKKKLRAARKGRVVRKT